MTVFVVGFLGAGSAFAAEKACTFSNVKQLNEHAKTHIKYPAKGKDIKEACKKEWPTEFSADEWACFDGKIKDDAEYKSAKELLKALNAK